MVRCCLSQPFKWRLVSLRRLVSLVSLVSLPTIRWLRGWTSGSEHGQQSSGFCGSGMCAGCCVWGLHSRLAAVCTVLEDGGSGHGALVVIDAYSCSQLATQSHRHMSLVVSKGKGGVQPPSGTVRTNLAICWSLTSRLIHQRRSTGEKKRRMRVHVEVGPGPSHY